jgi:hypothetical protein
LFVSHASEDKKDIVRTLATALRDLALNAWYEHLVLCASFLSKRAWAICEAGYAQQGELKRLTGRKPA